ncbi:thymidine kinase, cytosolic-like [Lineus longissimus]|uniref:thymidine kinase, cytosolic-like n=1 Tax=Lineus longissimus TaxID=88925 RepID=UPI002B4E1AE4
MMSCASTPDIIPTGKKGQIQIIFGPMFSGKSTELIRRMKRYQIAKYECLVIKYAKDTRYDQDGVATHDKQVLKAVGANELSEIKEEARKAEVIGIDEGQFFPDIVLFCEKMADRGKIVIVAALDGTYQRKGFGQILNLVPLAESIVKLTAVCMICFKEASFTKRTSVEEEVEVIGGEDKYLAVCRDCFKSPAVVASPRGKQNQVPSSTDKKTIPWTLRQPLVEKNCASRKLFQTPDKPMSIRA